MKERPLRGWPNGEVFSEAALGVRNAVKAGRMTVEKALELSERAYRDSMIVQAIGLPVETGSTQISEITPR